MQVEGDSMSALALFYGRSLHVIRLSPEVSRLGYHDPARFPCFRGREGGQQGRNPQDYTSARDNKDFYLLTSGSTGLQGEGV